MAKMKVSELPKEEQQALISEANALGLRGVLTTWGVETLKAKIEELKKSCIEILRPLQILIMVKIVKLVFGLEFIFASVD